MQDNDITKRSEYIDDELDLLALFHYFLKGKWVIMFITAFASIAGVIFSLNLPDIYQSNAKLVSVNPPQGVAGSLNSYSSLASFAGVDLPPQNSDSNSIRALEKVKSLSFFKDNILPNIFLPELMALKSWNSDNNSIVYDQDVYNEFTKTWINKIPSVQQSYGLFISEHLTVRQDTGTGFVTISIKHQSPFVAKKWTELVITQINSFYARKDKSEAEKAVNYLNTQIIKTSFSEIKQVIASLLQQETQKLTLIEANDSYVFDYIDPPAVMEGRISPRRSLICVISALLGFLLGILVLIIKYYFFKINDKAL